MSFPTLERHSKAGSGTYKRGVEKSPYMTENCTPKATSNGGSLQ